MTAAHRRARLAAVAAWLGALAVSPACAVRVEGDFAGVPFAPTSSAFALWDRHDFVPSSSGVLAVQKSETGQKLTLLLSSAGLDAGAEWRALPAARAHALRRALASGDGVLLDAIPLSALDGDTDLELTLPAGAQRGSGPFTLTLTAALPDDEAVAAQGLGEAISATLHLDARTDLAHAGSISGNLELQRAPGPAQTDGDFSTGAVRLFFDAPLVRERVGKANLAIARPVMICAADAGPVRAAACADATADPVIDVAATLPNP